MVRRCANAKCGGDTAKDIPPTGARSAETGHRSIPCGFGQFSSGRIRYEGMMKKCHPAESIRSHQFRHPALQQGGIKEIRTAYDQVHTKLQIV